MAETTLRASVLRGEVPSLDVLCGLGLDAELLDQRVDAIKQLLKYLEGYVPLEEACVLIRGDKPWSTLVAEAGYTGTRCFRMTQQSTDVRSAGGWELLTLGPINSGSDRGVEVFLLYDGSWLVWSDDHGFKLCPGASALKENLTAIAGDWHEYYTACMHCRHLEYWSSVPPGRRHKTVAIMLVLAAHVELLLEQSIVSKAALLASQRALLARFEVTDLRNGLLPEQTDNDA